MVETLKECLDYHCIDKDVKHIEKACNLLVSASKSWKPGRNFIYTSQEVLRLAVLSAKARLTKIVSSVMHIYECIFGSSGEFTDLVSLLFSEVSFQVGDFSADSINLAMNHIEKSVYEAMENDHDYIINNLIIILYKFVRVKSTSFKKADLILFLRQKLKQLLDTHNKNFSWIIKFGILLLETYVQVGSRKEASQLLETLASGVARHVPEAMVELLAIASGANLASAERYISWVLGVYNNNEVGSSVNQPIKHFPSNTKEGNLQMSGTLAQSLISFGIVPASRLAKLRASPKNPIEQVDEFLKILRLLEIEDKNDELLPLSDKQMEDRAVTLEDQVINHESNDNTDSNSVTLNNSEDTIEDALSPKYLTSETRFKLLVRLSQLALDRELLHICQKCIKQCENLIKKEKLPNKESASFMIQFISLEANTQKIAVTVPRMSNQYLTIHYHAMRKCHTLLEQYLSNSIQQPETATQGCLTLWHMCLPLIQHDVQTRLKTTKSLQLIIDYLTKQDSLHFRLRCQLHMTMAYCQADMEQITQAIDNIEKAIKFDETGEFSTNLNYFKKCLVLRSNLYEAPSTTIEQARQIVERLQNTNNLSSTEIIKLSKHLNSSDGDINSTQLIDSKENHFITLLRTLFIHISQLVDKTIFDEIYQLERKLYNDTKMLLTIHTNKHPEEILSRINSFKEIWMQLGDVTKNYSEIINKNVEYEINEKLLLWFDLIKLARKYQIWDLCSTLCRLCLVFDDDNYWNVLLKKLEQYRIIRTKPVVSSSTTLKSNEVNSNAQMPLRVDPQNMSNKPKTTPRTTTTPLDIVTSYELKLYSSLSEVYCIYAECLCMLLRQQSCGIQLAGNVENLKPAWLDTSLLTNRNENAIEELNEYSIQLKNYCEWFGLVNETALSAFQRSAVISARIADSKCLYSCAVCAWNYCLPTICQNDHRQITTTFSVILESANKIGLNCLPAQLYTEMATVLAHGLIQPWLPKPLKSIVHSGDEKNKSLPSSTTQKGQKTSRGKSAKPTTYTVPQEGQQCIKKAMDWLVLAGKLFEPNRLDLLQDIDETYTIQPVIPISTRSRLIICWLSARQLISSPPVHRGLFPMDLQGDSSSHGETNYTSDFEAQMRKMSLSNQKEAQIYVETLVTRTLLAVHSLWLTHKSKYISEWPVLVSKLIDEQSTQTIAESSKQIGTNLVGFKDAPSLTEAMYLMQTAFCGQKPNVQIEQPTGKSNIIKEQSKTPVKYDLRLDQSTAERYVELELWTRLAMIAFLTSQYSTVLDIIDLANIRKELTCSISPQQHQQQQSNVDNNYWLIQLLCLRGLAMFGISNQMKIVRQQNLKSGGKYNQQQQQQQQQMQQQTRGKQRLTDVKFKCVELLFRKRRINTGSEDSQTVESSLFEAGEEAFYEASRIAYKAGRYDLLVMSTSLYWTLLNHPTLSSSSSQIAQVLQKIQSFDEKIHNLTKWLSHCLKIEVRNELATQIRNNENKQDKSTDLSIVKIESVLMDSIRTIKEVSSLYETVTIVPYPTVTQFEMDLQLRVNMFTALYDLYSEQGNFTSALAVLAKATQNLPRTKHRMLLFRQLVITKAKLGQSVEFDMQKFTSESEPLQAKIWREIAYASSDVNFQVKAFKQSIDAIKNPAYWTLKSELLLEFSQWLFAHGFEVPVCISLAEEAMDLLGDVCARECDESQFKELKYSHLVCNSKNIEYLDILMRICVLLAEFVEAVNPEIKNKHNLNSLDYLIISVNCVKNILNLSVASIVESPRVEQRSPKSPRSISVKSRSKSNAQGGGETNRGKQNPEPIHKKIIPKTIAEWSVFEVSDDIIQGWHKNYTDYVSKLININSSDLEQREYSGLSEIYSLKQQINPTTIRYPLVTMASLDRLLNMITEMGPGQLGFPVLVLQDCILRSWARYDKSSSLANCTCVGKLIHLKSMELSCCLGLLSGVSYHQNKLNPLSPNEQEIADAYTLLKTNPSSQYLKDLIKNWIDLADRLTRIGQFSYAHRFLHVSEQLCQHENSQMVYWLLARARLSLAEGQYKLTRTLISKIFDSEIEDESFWIECLSIRIDALCYDPDLTAHDLGSLEMNEQTSVNYTSCPLHFGIEKAIEEIESAERDLQKRREQWKSRESWFNKLTGILLSKKAQLFARIDQMNYHYATLFSSTDKSSNSGLCLRPVNLLMNTNGAPKLFEEIIHLFAPHNKRTALRLGWMPLLAYWVNAFKAEVNVQVIHLRKELRHPSTTCLSFVTTLKVARQCLNFAQETVVLAESFSNTNELKGCSLPVRRELIEVKFMLVTILHSIMSLHVMYMKAKLQESTLKDPLFCAVENYIGENSLDSLPETLNNYEQPKQIWDRTILTAFDEIYSLLSDIFIMSEKQPHLLAQCFFYMGESLYLCGLLLIPDLQDYWTDHSGEAANLVNTVVRELLEKNTEDVNLHSGFRWRNRNDVINDLRTYDSVMNLFSQASSLYIISLKICFAQNFMGLARQVTESLLNLFGGIHESVSVLTQDLLIAFQSCSTAVRLRTHFWLTLLAYDARKCSGGTQTSFDTQNEFSDRSILSSSEALIRQLLWLSPSSVYSDLCLFTTWGFCSTTEPSSYPETLAWITGIIYNLISSRLRSTGGLCGGSEDHCVSASPWLSSVLKTLASQSQAWRVTEVNPSIIFDSNKIIQSTLSSLPGSNLQAAKYWNLLIMEHSINSCFLYAAVPKGMNRATSTRSHRPSIPTNKSNNKAGDCQYTFLKIETDPVTKCKLICSWKNSLNNLDEQLKKYANIKSNNNILSKEVNQIITMKSRLFKNSTEKVLLFNYLEPIFETLSKHWIPETTSNSSHIRSNTDTISVSDQKNIIPEINIAEQLSFYFEQHFNSQSNIPSDGLVVISDFWLNELPLEFLITNTLLTELCISDCPLYRRQSSLIRRGQTTAASNSSKQNRSPALKRMNRVLPFSWLTRDFSVQLLYSRLTGHQNTQKADDQSTENHEQSVQHKTARKTDIIRGSSRHPLLRDTGAKLPPLQSSKQQNSGCLVVNTTCMRYLVDPFLDTEIVGADTTTSASSEIAVGNDDDNNNNDNAKFTGISLKSHLQLLLKEPSTRSQQFTSRWIGLMGDWELGKIPTKEELTVFLNEGASGLISYSTESFLSYLPPSAFVNLSIPNCYFICHLDKIYTRSSRLRQMKLDAHKTIIERELEQALTTAVTSTLTGSRSVITLQWPTSLKINQFRLEKLLGYLLDQAYTIGQSTMLIQYELFKKELDEYKVRLKQINEVKVIQMSKENSLDEMNHHEGKYENIQMKMTPTLEPFNMIVYGLPNISFA